MNTRKVAITMPSDLVLMIDDLSKRQKISRSKFISIALREKLVKEKERHLKESFDRVFSDEGVSQEQLETAKWFEGSGDRAGQEW